MIVVVIVVVKYLVLFCLFMLIDVVLCDVCFVVGDCGLMMFGFVNWINVVSVMKVDVV